MGLFGRKKKKVSLQEADKMNQEFIANNPQAKDSEDALMRQASSAMTSGNFSNALALYTQMANEFPAKKGLYLSQVGAAHYFLEDYEAAIEAYVDARNNGMDESMIDDNIWEACETIYKKTDDKAALQKYLELCPNGGYVKKANKWLNS